jgi:hypothetical protein
MSRLVKTLEESPRGWYELEEGEDGGYNSPSPFAASGDSRSLVFTREDDIDIPLGIHVGSHENDLEQVHFDILL